jgi:hypothetical protein
LPGTTNDLVFTAGTVYNSQFTLNTTALTPGTIDDLNLTALNIVGTQSFTLSGGLNSVAPNAADLIYVANGGSMNLSVPVVLTTTAANGNFDIAGTAIIGGVISRAVL